VATNDRPLTRAWLWFGSDPHLAGMTATAFWVAYGLLGVVETSLRHSFDALWWWVATGLYLSAWLLTGLGIWWYHRRRGQRRSWMEVFVPPVSDDTNQWLSKLKQWLLKSGRNRLPMAIVLLIVSGSATVILITLVGEDRAGRLVAIFAAIVTTLAAVWTLALTTNRGQGDAAERSEHPPDRRD
jgi:hypothetical protein